MDYLFVFRSENGTYGFTSDKDVSLLPSELAPWTFWKSTRFDGETPLIGASRTSPEIKQIVQEAGYYLEGKDAELELD